MALDKVIARVIRVLDPNHVQVQVLAKGTHNVNAYPTVFTMTVGSAKGAGLIRSQESMVKAFLGQPIDIDITGATNMAYTGDILGILNPPVPEKKQKNPGSSPANGTRSNGTRPNGGYNGTGWNG